MPEPQAKRGKVSVTKADIKSPVKAKKEVNGVNEEEKLAALKVENPEKVKKSTPAEKGQIHEPVV